MVTNRTPPEGNRARPEGRSARSLALALIAVLTVLGLAALRRRRTTPLLEPPF